MILAKWKKAGSLPAFLRFACLSLEAGQRTRSDSTIMSST